MRNAVSETEVVDIRCPVGPQALLMRVRVDPSLQARVIDTETLPVLELACRDCARLMRRHGEEDVTRVLHRFDPFGNLVETLVEHEND